MDFPKTSSHRGQPSLVEVSGDQRRIKRRLETNGSLRSQGLFGRLGLILWPTFTFRTFVAGEENRGANNESFEKKGS